MKWMRAGKLFVALAAVALSTAAWSQVPDGGPMGMHRPPMERAFGGPGPMGRWWNEPKMIEKLKLTDEQRKAFDQILEAHREKLIDLKANLEKAELPMHALMDADQPDEGKILAQIDKTVAARAALEKANASFLLALRAKLSVEQWKQLKEMHERRGEMREGMREHGRPGREGDKDGAGMPPPPGPQGMADDGGQDDGPVNAPEAGPAR